MTWNIALLANTITGRGLESIVTVINFIIATYVSIAIMFIVQLVIVMANGLNPIKYIKNTGEALMLAFTSRSSLGTLPVTIECLSKKSGVDEGVSSFVASLSANMGMNGCAGIYPALVAVTLANTLGIETSLSFYVSLLLVIAVASLGIAGIPGSATIAVSVVLSGVGLGEYFPLVGAIIAVDPIIDMGRTMLNVSGGMTTAITVGKSLDKVDVVTFNEEK